MLPSDEGQLFGLYGYLVLTIFLALICILLFLSPDTRARLPWHNFIEAIRDTNADISKSNTSVYIVPQSTNGVQLIQSKKNPTLRKRSIRKTTTTLSSTTKSSPSSSSTKLSDKSSSFSSSSHSFNSIEDCHTVDGILKNEQNECVYDTNLCSVKQKPVASEQMMTTMTDKNIVSKDADSIASTIHEVAKTSSSKGSSTTAKSLKTKKSNPTHHESCKAVVESSSPPSSLLSSSTVPESLNNSYISTPVPGTSVTPQALDTTGNDDGEWLCANIKTVRRRRRNNNNKDIKQLMSTDNNNDDVHIDDTKLEGHVLQPQPIELSSVMVAEKNSQHKSNSTHDISSNDKQYSMTGQDIINSKTNENLEPDSSHQCVVECCNKTSSIIENIDSSLKKQSSTEHSLKDPSVPSNTTNITTTITTTTSSSSNSNNDPSLIVLHSTSIVTSKRKRRNIPNKKSTDEIIINNNESIESYSILCNENQLDDDNNSMSTVTTTNTTSSSSTTTNTNISTPINSSMKRNLHKKHEDDENGFELIELPNTSSSSSAIESDELEMHTSSLTINTTTTSTTTEKSSLTQAPPDLLSHFPPLIKTDNGDPIAVTMEVELLEGGRHPQANKLLKSALSSNNNNNQISNQQEQSTDDYVGKTCSTTSNSGGGNKTTMKRSKVRKAD
ncbi:unnamed protein product [Schistosoma rodhaini]|uniref:Serine/threonine-protein kinase DDB_G0282963 n=1 Tax=Schistosoma mansoni TaxID=6183 RepID=A0A3Q0KVL5_SCHMA|nr:unnamed protein product [Schistosoma rodhaini]